MWVCWACTSASAPRQTGEKKSRKRRDVDDDFEGGEEIEGKRRRARKEGVPGGERKERRKPAEIDEETLDPEERKIPSAVPVAES